VNNFATQAACWKCGAALSATPASGRAAAVPPATPSSSPLPVTNADPAIADWAAVALALLFPWVAVPAGLVFLMLDDRRKIQLGKLTLIWGVLATVLHLFVTAWLVREAVSQVRGLLPAPPGRSQPRPDTPVPPIEFPGLNQ
jgi:hypothetical protein